MSFDYFYGNMADQFSFYRIPRCLMTSHDYVGLSVEAKLLYGLILDRMGESLKSNWVDEERRVYITYPICEIQKDLHVSRKNAIKHLCELTECGLVTKRVRGLGFQVFCTP